MKKIDKLVKGTVVESKSGKRYRIEKVMGDNLSLSDNSVKSIKTVLSGYTVEITAMDLEKTDDKIKKMEKKVAKLEKKVAKLEKAYLKSDREDELNPNEEYFKWQDAKEELELEETRLENTKDYRAYQVEQLNDYIR